MMKLETVKDELYQIAKAYPLLLGLMKKKFTGKVEDGEPATCTVGEHWAKLMVNLDSIHFENVCDEYATMDRRLPDPTDQLPYEIIREVKERTALEVERLEQHQKYHQKVPPWRESVSRSLWCRVVKFLLDVKCTPEQTKVLAAWSIGDGEPPDWLTDEQKQTFFATDFEKNE